ncbi:MULTISPECIES: hypothetical protein [unclassified Microcoleus]|uniref:hypothetical protein n=1 Tax=unclassified Microcoleus TaxID=2642155 RepID=UPI0025CC2ED7|nr:MULTISPECIES: hypothetical protein [unclassified Microcoleus]
MIVRTLVRIYPRNEAGLIVRTLVRIYPRNEARSIEHFLKRIDPILYKTCRYPRSSESVGGIFYEKQQYFLLKFIKIVWRHSFLPLKAIETIANFANSLIVT